MKGMCSVNALLKGRSAEKTVIIISTKAEGPNNQTTPTFKQEVYLFHHFCSVSPILPNALLVNSIVIAVVARGEVGPYPPLPPTQLSLSLGGRVPPQRSQARPDGTAPRSERLPHRGLRHTGWFLRRRNTNTGIQTTSSPRVPS